MAIAAAHIDRAFSAHATTNSYMRKGVGASEYDITIAAHDSIFQGMLKLYLVH